MGKKKKRARRRRRRTKGWQRRATARKVARGVVADYAADVGLDPGSAEASLLARLVECSSSIGYHSSNWIVPAMDGLVAAGLPRGWTPIAVLDALERMQRWSHRVGRLSVLDAGCQLLNVELMRRRRGAPARLVVPPSPRDDEEPSARELWEDLVCWEALSYGEAAFQHGGDLPSGMILRLAAELLVEHLAEVDGLPVRWDRLDPAAFAAGVPAMLEAEKAVEPAPEILAELLDSAGFVLSVVVPPVSVAEDVLAAKARELSTLALAYSGGVRAA